MTTDETTGKEDRYWLVVGSVKNWQTAFDHGNIWGLKVTQRHLWDNLQEDDILLFYATTPVVGVIGYGTVRTKFRQDKPLWPQELKEGKVIWPLRFEFDVEHCIPPDRWREEKLISKDLWPRGGFQMLSRDIGERLVPSLKRPEYSIPTAQLSVAAEAPAGYEPVPEGQPKALPSHDDVKEALVEIGKLQQFIAEPEYQFDIGRLDVVWRRVQQSVPTYVFEIQIGGNLYQAMAKLKHAFDLWNSHVFLVCSEDDFDKASRLLSGTFHESSERIKLIDYLRVGELLQLKKGSRHLEKELGIL